MTDAIAAPEEKPRKKKGMLIPILATLVLGGAGFGTTYLGLWSPGALLARPDRAAIPERPAVAFIDVPVVEILLPGGNARSLVLAAVIETDGEHGEAVRHLMPRVTDAFTTFLSGVDPAAYDKRGVLEIIRAELMTRTRLVLGEAAVKDLLITEFRFK